MEEQDFKDRLNPEQYRVMRLRDTERPYSGKYWDSEEHGLYSCAACGNAVFNSLTKFDAENGWPSFTATMGDGSVDLTGDPSHREVVCHRCQSHVGYVEIRTDNGKPYYRVNSASLVFAELPDVSDDDGDDEKKKSDAEKNSLKKTIQNLLVVLAAALVGGGVGYASGTALCNSTYAAIPAVSASVSVSPSVPPTMSVPSPTPRPTAPAATPTPTKAPPASVVPVSTASASSADGSVPTP